MFQYDKNGAFDRAKTINAVYDAFTHNKSFFRLIISIQEKYKVKDWTNLQGSIYYQLWQSIEEPWIFLIYIDIAELKNFVEEFIDGVNKHNYNQVSVTPLGYFSYLEKGQRERFNIFIEGEQVQVPINLHSNANLRPFLTNDPFNVLRSFQQIFSHVLGNQIFENRKENNTEYNFRGLSLSKIQDERLFFHALRHPEQYISETIGESIDKLLSSFDSNKKEA